MRDIDRVKAVRLTHHNH